MSFINPREKEINCKVAYYGAPFTGKSTTLRYLYEKVSHSDRGKMVTLSGEEDGSLFFDFLPLLLGKVKGYTIRFQLYSVPGQVIYNSARSIILKGIDGVVFVVDSRIERVDENLESWKSLQKNLKNHDVDFKTIPLALQYNKRDLKDILPISDLQGLFNPENKYPTFETVATKGTMVLECFQSMAKNILGELKK